MIQIKKAYEPVSKDDGIRFLVERLWPRGIKKENLQVEAWLKDIAPSTELPRWFQHDPAKWDEIRRRYFSELGKRHGKRSCAQGCLAAQEVCRLATSSACLGFLTRAKGGFKSQPVSR